MLIKPGDRIRRISGEMPWCPIGYETIAEPGTDDRDVWYVNRDGGTNNAPVEWWELVMPSLDLPDEIIPTMSPEEALQELHVTEVTPLRVQILHSGAALTHGQRDAEYGPPSVNMAAAGAIKKAFREHLARDIDPAELEALDMVMTKLGRIATGTPKLDTYVDAATYFAIAGEIALTPTTPATGETNGN